MKLISMTDFVLEQQNIFNSRNTDKLETIENYANFLKKPLKLEMFVPCDELGRIIEEPHPEDYSDCNHSQNILDYRYNLEIYQKAKQKVIFNGFIFKDNKSPLALVQQPCSVQSSTCYLQYHNGSFFKPNPQGQSTKLENVESLIPFNLDLLISF